MKPNEVKCSENPMQEGIPCHEVPDVGPIWDRHFHLLAH